MKIALVSKGDPGDVKTWSGIPYYIREALLKRGYTVDSINLLHPKEPRYYSLYRYVVYKLFRKWFWAEMEPYLLKQIGRQFDQDVNRLQPDLVLLIHGHFLAYTHFKQPTIVVHDTTFAQIITYYPEFMTLANRSIFTGNLAYQRGLDRAIASVFSSSWASQSAINDYHSPACKVHTIPLGANLSQTPDKESVGLWTEQRASSPVCHFLFIGIEWERKGGPDALRFVEELNHLSIESYLTIVGCTPTIPEEKQRFVNQIGYLSKNVAGEAEKLDALFRQSTALLLPSLAECYGCVYCEANAYGLPALGRDTGGIPEIIKDGVNGLLMHSDESPEAFASRWARIWLDRSLYIGLSASARREFDDRLNYQAFVAGLEEVITNVGIISLGDQVKVVTNSGNGIA